MKSIFFILFCIAQETPPTIEVIAHDDRDIYTNRDASVVIPVEDKDQSLYRDSGDALTFISNSNVSGGSNRIRFLQFRGVGESSQYENTPTHSISYLVDGVDVTGILAHWPLLDVKRLRVEKQPSSILYGGYAIGGVVEATLQDSAGAVTARATADSRRGHGGDVSVPLSDHRVSIHYNNDAGYVHNTLHNESGNSRREVYSSLKSQWARSERFRFESTILSAHFNNRYDVWSLKNNDETSSDRPGKDNLGMVGASFTAKYVLSDTSVLQWWTSWTSASSLYSYDADWSNNIYWNSVPGWNANYDYYDEFDRDRKQWQSRISWHVSGFDLGVHVHSLIEDTLTGSFKNGLQRSSVDSRFDQASLAVHAGYNLSISERMRWGISSRADRVTTSYDDRQGLNETFREPQFALATQLDFSVNSEHVLAASLRQGYKNPIINIDPDIPLENRKVESEKALNLELSHRWTFNTSSLLQSVFVRQGTNQHVRVSRQMDSNDPSSYIYFYDNAAKTRASGYELAAQHRFDGGAEVRGSLGFLYAQFTDYNFDGQTMTGRELAQAPKNTWALQWLQPLAANWNIVGQTEGRSSFYFSNNHGVKNPSYVLAHLAVQYHKGPHHWDIGVRNLFDKQYGLRAFYFANEPPDFVEKAYLQNGPPQVLYVNYRWALPE